MHQGSRSGEMVYNDGFITTEWFDASINGVFYEFKASLAKHINAEKMNFIILSLTIIGESK
jgi:hypothetical protein